MAQKKISRTRQKIHDLYEENEFANLKQSQTRARSFSIGTTCGGISRNYRAIGCRRWS